jgi:peptidoglycan hydrolase CwlO-like protein
MSLDKLANDSRAKVGTAGALLAAVVALNIMTWSMRDKVAELHVAVVQAQASQRNTDGRVDALEVRMQRLEDRYLAHAEVFAATIAQWKEAMKQWGAEPAPPRGRR